MFSPFILYQRAAFLTKLLDQAVRKRPIRIKAEALDHLRETRPSVLSDQAEELFFRGLQVPSQPVVTFRIGAL